MQGGSLKQRAVEAGLDLIHFSGLGRVMAPMARGLGAILMFHHVRPWAGQGFAPNRGLEITPEFLDLTLQAARALGFSFVSMDELVERLRGGRPAGAGPVAALTFDDGLRDNVEHGLPVLERHCAPFTMHVTTGFADRAARMWWIELEEAIRGLDEVPFRGGMLPARSDAEKSAAFETFYWAMRPGPEEQLRAEVAELAERAGVDVAGIAGRTCLGWDELAGLARHPLCTIGVHTLTHPMLARHPVEVARRELADSRSILMERLGVPAHHLAYPVGDATSAGPREFALAQDAGFVSGVTTRRGMLFPEHRDHLLALPRLAINGAWQSRAAVSSLLTGAPFYLASLGRRLAA